MKIQHDDLTSSKVIALLKAHHAEAQTQVSKAASHIFSVEKLKHPDVTFWTVWDGQALMGCGALVQIAHNHGEIKSMHTARDFRRRGVSSAILRHMIKEARMRGYEQISLETHPTDGYAPARALYKRFGFTECAAFGVYTDVTSSVFMTLKLSAYRP